MTDHLIAPELPCRATGSLPVRGPHLGRDGATTVRCYRYVDSDVEVPPMCDVMVVAYRRGTRVREPGSDAALSFRCERAVSNDAQSHLHHRVALDELARLVELSEFHFVRQFASSIGTSSHELVLRRRRDRRVRPSPTHPLRLRLRSQAPRPEENPI